MAVWPFFDQAEAAEADQELPHTGRSGADLARQFKLVDLHAGLGAAGENPAHETALDDFGERIGLFRWEVVVGAGLPQHVLLALVPGDELRLLEAAEDRAHRRPADAEHLPKFRLGGQRGCFRQKLQAAVIGILEDGVLFCHGKIRPVRNCLRLSGTLLYRGDPVLSPSVVNICSSHSPGPVVGTASSPMFSL
ncbi:hypothetical protein D9M70_479260 [compost metagenome]